MKIQAAVTHVCAAPFQIETVDLAEPKSGEILVKIAACGVCHTDESAQNEQVPTKLPAVLGHEGAGVVEKVGPNVTEFQPGDRVGFSFAYCGQCPACRNSKVSSCRDFNKINFGGVLREGTSRLSQNGQPLSMFFGQSAFAEYAVADAESAVKVPYEDIDLGLVAPLGCGIQTGAGTVLNRLKPKFGKTDFKTMTPMDLKESIFKSEGRVIMGQHLLFDGKGLVRGITNSEVMFAFGADMVLLNTIDLDNWDNNPGLQGLTYQELKTRCNRPIGIYLGCPKAEDAQKENALYRLGGMLCTPDHVEKCVEMGVDFIVLGGNPGSGTSISDVVACTKWIKEKYGDKLFVFAGKWEDGIHEKVLGDPLAQYDAKEVIRELIDAGADCIDLPAPGSRHGISVSMIQELVQYVHTYKPGTLAMTFLNSSVEGADPDTIRLIALKMKETGADVHAIGDGGFAGCTSPENIFQLAAIGCQPEKFYIFSLSS